MLPLLLSLLASVPLALAGTASVSPKMQGVQSQGAVHAKLDEPSADILMEPEDPDAEEEAEISLPAAAGGASGCNEDNIQLLRRVAVMERQAAEQDSALAQLKRSVRELRDLRYSQQDRQEAAAGAAPCPERPCCEHCPA
mmetsp:Transcript_16917/g.39769  ORF Transcript_16917/g.39769 Transcript_16917/m.39769 type:complete len:140 (-) Transcript_16917:127-546(-)